MVYCFLANGFEEIEALATVDILRRAEIEVLTVGVDEDVIIGSHQIPVLADIREEGVKLDSSLEAVILPGGMPGTLNLQKSSFVQKAIDYALENDKYLCAICAAPLILGHKEILKDKKATCYPGFECDLKGADVTGGYVEADGKVITAKGAGVAIDFALKITEMLKDKETADKINASIQSK